MSTLDHEAQRTARRSLELRKRRSALFTESFHVLAGVVVAIAAIDSGLKDGSDWALLALGPTMSLLAAYSLVGLLRER